MWWLVGQSVRRAPRRLLLAAVAVGFPVAVASATLLFVDDSLNSMTTRALATNQIEMRGLATTLTVDMADVQRRLRSVPEVAHADLFGAADVIVGVPGGPQLTARLFAVDPAYLEHHSWVGISGDLGSGILIDNGIAGSSGFVNAAELTIALPGDPGLLDLRLAVAGRVDVRQATTWLEIPAGGVQGDLAAVPRAVLVGYATFERDILPALQQRYAGAAAVTDPGLADLPPVSLEVHVTVDHARYPADPALAADWSSTLRRTLERQVPGDLIVADNAYEPLIEASSDATNAKVIFFLLGVPGALVAVALGLAAASALTESTRREETLLRLRGAADSHIARLAVWQGLLAGFIGTALGLAIGGAAVWLVVGHPVWQGIPAGRLVIIALLATATGAVTTGARLLSILRGGPRADLVVGRRHLAGRWAPLWLRARLDFVAFGLGLLILVANIVAGGVRPAMVDLHQQAQTLVTSFYVLLAPVLLWIGGTLLVLRLLLALLARWSRPDRPRALTSWGATSLRWLGRRPARTASALLLGSLAVAFGTQVLAFTATYESAKRAEAGSAYGADLRLEPRIEGAVAVPELGPDVAAVTPIWFVPAQAGSDRKSITAIDPHSYAATVTAPQEIVRGGGIDALAREPMGALVLEEVVADYGVAIGDLLPVTMFPDDPDRSQLVDLVVVGVFRSVPPTDPLSEVVISAAAIPAPTPPPDLYLGRAAPGLAPEDVAAAVSADAAASDFTVTSVDELVRKEQRSLTALNLTGLGRIEAVAATAMAALGVGVLGAFLVLERRRELAILRSVGAGRRQIVTPPLLEGCIAAVGSLLIGIPVGLVLALLAVRELDIFFTLSPPLLTVPVPGLLVLMAATLLGSALALVIPLRRTAAAEVSSVLREV